MRIATSHVSGRPSALKCCDEYVAVSGSSESGPVSKPPSYFVRALMSASVSSCAATTYWPSPRPGRRSSPAVRPLAVELGARVGELPLRERGDRGAAADEPQVARVRQLVAPALEQHLVVVLREVHPRTEIGEPAIAAIRDVAALVDQQRELGDAHAARQRPERRHLVVAGGVGRADELASRPRARAARLPRSSVHAP